MNLPIATTLILSIGIVAAGVVMTGLDVRSANWIHRSGSLVVLVGVLSGLGSFATEAMLRDRLNMSLRQTRIRVQRFYRRNPEARKNALEELEERFRERLGDARDHARLQFGVLEVFLVTMGTLLWGFGDLIAVDF